MNVKSLCEAYDQCTEVQERFDMGEATWCELKEARRELNRWQRYEEINQYRAFRRIEQNSHMQPGQ
jgi:hypothetical protein